MQINRMWQGQDLEEILAERFHISTSAQWEQRKLVEGLLRGERLLTIQPMDREMQRCFLVASVCLPHLTLVISPQRELLRDQYRHCSDSYDISCALVSADKSSEENYATFTQALAGNIKILFLAPEPLDNTGWQRYIPKMKISLLVIEQAHCISTRSHDFRPYYQRAASVISHLAFSTPTLILSEAANKQVETDIFQQFCATNIVRSSLRRPHLHLHVVQLHGDWEKLCYLAAILQEYGSVGIIYTATQGSALMIAQFLCACGIKALYKSALDKDRVQSDNARESARYCVLYTISRQHSTTESSYNHFVIHYHAPDTLFDYHQDVSKSCQGFERTWCVLLYDPADLLEHERCIGQEEPQEKHYVEVLSLLRVHSQGTHENNLLLNTGLSQSRLHIILDDLLEQKIITFNEDMHRYMLSPDALSTHRCTVRDSASTMGNRRILHRAVSTLRIDSARGSQRSKPPRWEESRHERGIANGHMYGLVDFSIHEQIRRKKLEELVALRQYTRTAHCYMAYLSNHLGDEANGYERCGVCSNCSPRSLPDIYPTQRIQIVATQFLERDFLPRIEQQHAEGDSIHEAGWSLSYQTGSRIGRQVYASKYQSAGPFPLGLVSRAVEIARTRYPVRNFHAVVSVPPSESEPLVEMFAQQVAEQLGTAYFAGLVKMRPTYIQRRLSNKVRKANNVRGAFAVVDAAAIVNHTLLLIDDIYDSGCTIFEAGKALMEAGAQAVYPLTIIRTLQTEYGQGGML